jgi:hypothetical protein
MPRTSNLDHRLQLRLPKQTVADIDAVIASHPQLGAMSRCLFIRYALHYGLISFEKYDKEHASQETE